MSVEVPGLRERANLNSSLFSLLHDRAAGTTVRYYLEAVNLRTVGVGVPHSAHSATLTEDAGGASNSDGDVRYRYTVLLS